MVVILDAYITEKASYTSSLNRATNTRAVCKRHSADKYAVRAAKGAFIPWRNERPTFRMRQVLKEK